MASKRKEIESILSKGTSEAARLHVYIHHYMSLLYKRYLNQKQKIMNMGMKNVSKEMIQMPIALSLKSWSKPSTLIVILWQCDGATDLIGDFVVKSAMGRGVHGMIVHPSLISINREWKMPFFLTLQSVQTLSDPKVIDRIKKKLFGAIVITRKIILEGGLVVDDGSGSGSGSGVAVGANDASLTVFERTNHYDYNHTGYTDFAPSSECSVCKCQDCKAKHDRVCTDWSTIEAYQDKMGNPFDVEYVEGIAQQSIGSLNCGIFVATSIEYLSDELQVPNDELDAGLHRKKYSTLLWIYGEAKAQKPYASNIKDPR
ncbi:hypothetical protein CQW23_19334 [Capsicum baccatum]|uniref:Ubiquitin-like protease family profile domain-containing protein n=1 Tax=Capsicum baccatum TaxID=33114 RepID=A0A2G2W5H5_CAPBA|nr:hypothetical protein CQW23_19334 [Capsicum baccatum]